MKGGSCIYYNGIDHGCSKGVEIITSFGADEALIPCISGGDDGKRARCSLHRLPTTREMYEANQKG